MDIVKACFSEKLFKPCFRILGTWAAWMTLLKALFGLSMTKGDLSLFKRCTGRSKAPEGEFKEFWAIVGRRGGKSFISAIMAVYLALFYDYKQYLAPGEKGVIQIIAADRSQAQVILSYTKGILHSNPVFEQYIESELKESIDLTNGICITVMSASFRLVRGRSLAAVILDEIAFFRAEGANPDVEILAAIRPAMATIPNSKLIVISSPYARSGVLYETHRDYFGKDNSDILVWQADTRTMNPTISQELIDRETKKDPSAARAEWQALFRDDIETFLDPQLVEACAVLPAVTPPDKYTVYQGFVDPSGGRADAFTVSIGHHNREIFYIDLVRAWVPPFNPPQVVKEIAEVLSEYRITRATGDRYAGAWVSSAFEKQGINYSPCEVSKSNLYLSLEPFINASLVQFPKDKHLITELINLERKRGKAGKDSVDHPPRGSDDRANVVAGVCHLLEKFKHSAFHGCDLT